MFSRSADEVRGWSPNSNDEVGRFVHIESVEIIHEGAVCFVVGQPGVQKRVIVKIHWRLRPAVIPDRMNCAIRSKV